MKRLSTRVFLGLLILLLAFGCKKDPVLDYQPTSEMLQAIENGRIDFLGVHDEAVLTASIEIDQIGIYHKFAKFWTYLNQFSSTFDVTDINYIESLNRKQILIGFKNRSIFAFDDVFIPYFTATTDVFNKSCDLVYTRVNKISYINKTGKSVDIYPPTFSQIKNNISCIAACRDSVWLGTSGIGLYHILPNGDRIIHLAQNKDLPDNYVMQIAFDSSKNMVVLCQTGLCIKTAKGWKVIPGHTGVLHNKLSIGPDGQIYIATNTGIYLFKDDQLIPMVALNKRLPNKEVLTMAIDSDKVLWIGTKKGLYKWPQN
jgi:hypothetical protein